MTHFRDHADAMRVIGATFTSHALFDQPCQSWMVRRAPTGEHISSSAHHFVVTWLPGRALIVTGDIGEAIYCGITHLASLEETIRLVREAAMDYLSSKSTHKSEFDFDATACELVSRAYDRLRKYGDDTDMQAIIDWSRDADVAAGMPQARKTACSDLLNTVMTEHELWEHFGDIDPPVCMSWPPAAHWHYEALRTWADLMARSWSEGKIAEDSASSSAGEAA